jgi:hypothetical protein
VERGFEDLEEPVREALNTLGGLAQSDEIPEDVSEDEVRHAFRLALPVFLELLGAWNESETEREEARDLVVAFIMFGALEKLWGESLEELHWFAEQELLAERLEDEFGRDPS